MSQFDFPKLNFSGRCLIDPATANNGWYMPLVIFEPILIKAVCPPRVYLEDIYILKGKTLNDIIKLLPEGAKVQYDSSGAYKGAPFVEISPINNADIFKEWATLPLGDFPLDAGYKALYAAVGSHGAGPLLGSTPGYWNYYGSMEYRYLDVQVCSIEVGISKSGIRAYNTQSADAPGDVKKLLGAELNMCLDPHDASTNSAVMIDLLPTMAMYSQVFCDYVNIVKDGKILMSGKPCKASLRLVNAFRVTNENMPQGASGVFFSAIPLEDLVGGEASPIVSFFEKYRDRSRKLKGVFIQQVLSEVEEVRVMDYKRKGNISNPAFARLCGSISPWYEDDLKNWPLCRQLNGAAPFQTNKPPGFMAPVSCMTPAVFFIDYSTRFLRLDFLNNFPVINTNAPPGVPATPRPDEINTYETYKLGPVSVMLQYNETPGGAPQMLSLGVVNIDNIEWPRERYFLNGGIINLPIPKSVDLERLRTGTIMLFFAGSPKPIMVETPLVIVSEQCGMYANVNDDPLKGFISNSPLREPCVLRIFERGRPCPRPVPINIIEIKITNGGSSKSETILRSDNYTDGSIIVLPNTEPANAAYLFSTEKPASPLPEYYPAMLLQSGFVVNLKVLPRQDYSQYLDPSHPEYINLVDFDVIYKEIFETYALIAPLMRFNRQRWNNKHMAQLLVEKSRPEIWNSAAYMPMSRDLSNNQYQLLLKWAASFAAADSNNGIQEEQHILKEAALPKALQGVQFFNK